MTTQKLPGQAASYALGRAFTEVSASSAGGAPFLMAYGATFLLTGMASFFIPRPTAALLAMFQGGAALPLAFWLERKMGTSRMSPDNPLKALSMLLAISQGLALPLLILVYSLNPGGIPLAMAALGGVHFLPYAWLHRTWLYTALALAISLGAFALQLGLGTRAFSFNLLYVALIYGITAPLVYRHAAQQVQAAA